MYDIKFEIACIKLNKINFNEFILTYSALNCIVLQ